MGRLTFPERLRIGAINAERRRREVVSRTLNAPPFRWRRGSGRVDQLLIVPQDLRTPDPSLWLELRAGQFGLAGSLARLDANSPFDIVPPSEAWQRSLHGFSWLRHLQAAEDPAACEAARRLAVEWSIRHGNGVGFSWRPEIVARRVISWLSHAGCLLDGADDLAYDTITSSLGAQLVRLGSSWREAPEGQQRLMALLALVLADLCVAGHDRGLSTDVGLLVGEIERQILPDGGHASRNSAVLVDLLLDLLPLKECFRARSQPVPPEMSSAIESMLAMLRYMRLGDGLLARFNGVGIPSPASLATVLAYADLDSDKLLDAPYFGYVRLARKQTMLIADAGPPPPMTLAAAAAAGCLSFELSSGEQVILANCGMPGSANTDRLAVARSTASHNTLVLGETSSSSLIVNKRLDQVLPGRPIRGPAHVAAELLRTDDGAIGFEGHHDGYLSRFGMLHQRRIMMDSAGRRIDGTDWLKPPRGTLRLKQDVPFAIHFHLYPGVTCQRAGKVGTVIITAGDECWRFAAEGAPVRIEESAHFADTLGPLRSRQLVLRGSTFGETEVRWAISRI